MIMSRRLRSIALGAATGTLALALIAGCTAAAAGTASTTSMAPGTATTTAAADPTTAQPLTSDPVTVPSLPDVSATTEPTTSSSTPTPMTTPKAAPATVSGSPKLGSTGLSPRDAIAITAAGGTITKLTMTNPEGNPVKGKLSADKKTWTVAEPLGYGRQYKVTGTAVNADGVQTPISGSYSTVEPDGIINASISPGDDDVVGIAAPILISFGTDITDRASAERAITVQTTPKTEGSFAWIHHDDGWGLDWRPKEYWKPGTKVKVTANLYGVSYGDNLWGKEDLTSQFTIGRAQVVKGDINSHRMKVYRDGKLLFDFPTSYGLESDPGRVTVGGTFIVMSKEYLHLMSNPKYGYKDFKAYYAVRFSNNGQFIHANDGTADVQGYENVTHGCLNLTTENAKAYYDSAIYGDPVEITGSSQQEDASTGDIYDWSIPWNEWKSKSALASQN